MTVDRWNKFEQHINIKFLLFKFKERMINIFFRRNYSWAMSTNSICLQRFSEFNVLQSRKMGAKGVLDTEQTLLGRLRSLEINSAGCDAGG